MMGTPVKAIWLLISLTGSHPSTDPAQFIHAFSSKAACESAIMEWKYTTVVTIKWVCVDIPVDDQ